MIKKQVWKNITVLICAIALTLNPCIAYAGEVSDDQEVMVNTEAEDSDVSAKTDGEQVVEPEAQVTAETNKISTEILEEEKEFKITISLGTSSSDITNVSFGVWGESNGQNDLKWYDAGLKADGTYTAIVPVSNHGETGRYQIHAYSTQNGNMAFLAGDTVLVTRITGAVKYLEEKSDMSQGTYRMEISDLLSPAAVTGVQVAVWSEQNGQDDLKWYQAVTDGGIWYIDARLSDHGYDIGEYNVHVYAQDQRGVNSFVNGLKFQAQAPKQNQLSILKNADESKLQITLTNGPVHPGCQMKFAVWGDENGQNDLKWYDGMYTQPGIYKLEVPISVHGEAGIYNVHVYESLNGQMTAVVGGIAEISRIKGNMKFVEEKSDKDAGKYRLEVSGLVSPAQVTGIQIAVWSKKNGQDDLRWYAAEQKDGIWSADMDLGYHNYETGEYEIHAYAQDTRGVNSFCSATVVNASEVADNKMSISINTDQSVITIDMRHVNVTSASDIVSIGVWGSKDGQNDLRWYTADKISAGTYQLKVNVSDHKEAGEYLAHAYLATANGLKFLTFNNINVEGISWGKTEIARQDNELGTFDVKITGADSPAGIKGMSAGVWTEANGQDDLHWYDAVKKTDGWYITVDTANHGFETGRYNVHVYAADKRNINTIVAGMEVNMSEPQEGASVEAAVNEDQVTVKIKASGVRTTGKVEAAVWGSADDQNDLRWYELSRTQGTRYEQTINLFDHLETGVYYCDVYVTKENGQKVFGASTKFSVNKLKSNYVRTMEFDNVNGVFTTKLYFPDAGKEIDRIRMGVWTEANGQDDIQWYTMKQEKEGYTGVVDSINHKCESGTYNVHIYANCKDGTAVFLAAAKVQVTRLTRRYQNPPQYYQIQDSITLTGGGYNLSYGYEGVKVMKVIQRLGLGSGIGMGGAFYSQGVANAVAAFQRSKGLSATGTVDLLTWLYLGFNEIEWNQWGAYVSPIQVNRNSTRSEHIEAMIATASNYLGTPYVIGASGPPGTGIDCSGLVMQGLYAAGIDTSPINPVRHASPGYEYESRNMWASSRFMHVPYSERQRGDLIFYQNSSGVVIHVAIYLGNDQVIEAWPNEVVVWPVRNGQRSNIKGVARPFV